MLVSHLQRIGSSDPISPVFNSKHYSSHTVSLHEDFDRRYSLNRTSTNPFQNDLARKDLFEDRQPITKQQDNFYSQHDKPRMTELMVRPVLDEFENEEDRRRTVGGSPLQGLINEFRNNSLGSDLRKLKEAHQQIIQDLKSAIFKKKSKKQGKSPHNYPKAVNPNTKQQHKDVKEQKDYGVIVNKKPLTQTASTKINIPHEKYRSSDDISKTIKRYVNEQHRKVVEVPPETRHKNKELRHNPQAVHHVPSSVKSPNYRQIKKQLFELTKEDRQERMNQEIMYLRQAKIDLLKQLNQETSNYNQVMVENKRVLLQNKQLKQQLRKQESESVQQLKYQNKQLREQLAKCENLLKPGPTSPKSHQEVQRVREQLDQQKKRCLSLVIQLQQYRSLYGGLPRSTYPQANRTKKW